MPFQPINFASLPVQGSPFFDNLVSNLTKGYQAGWLPSQLAQNRDTQNIANAMTQAQTNNVNTMTPLEAMSKQIANQYAPQMNAADLGQKLAQTNNLNQMTPLDVEKSQLANKFYPSLIQSQINLNNMGGARGPAGTKEQMFLNNQIKYSNPNLTPQQQDEAINNAMAGKNTLSDGTPINISGAAQASLGRLAKGTTTSGILNNLSQTQGRQAELPIISDYISKAIQPYGDTYFGSNGELRSPQLEKDMLKSDPASQIKVGRFLAGQQFNFEKANIANALAMGKGGVEVVNEIIKNGKQAIKSSDLKLSGIARQEASRYYEEGVNKAVDARLNAPTNASAILNSAANAGKDIQSQGNSPSSSMPSGSSVMILNGKAKTVPNSQIDYWKSKGANLQ